MDLLKIAADLFLNKLGTSADGVDSNQLTSALGSLLGGADGQIDLSDLISKVSNGGLASLAQSWLGDGANDGFSVDQVMSVLGQSQVSEFSSSLGLDEGAASNALSDMIPELIDQNSSAGGLLEAVGGVSGLAGMASKFFK
ncbi:YidB family protein [Neptunomonas japonica]|uniref:YidB family protein n=1 Tax=Neptunomonas japonica TaxID=417574 RepID=UPI0003F93C86|nr:YidB family protein [Neptunomonas japonica]